MAKLKKKSVQEAVEEMTDVERCELALELHRDKLDKMYKKRDKLENEAYMADLRIPLLQLNIKDLNLVIFHANLIIDDNFLLHGYGKSYTPNSNSMTIKYEECVIDIDKCFKNGTIWMQKIIFVNHERKSFYMMQREDFKLFIDIV